MFKHSLPSIEQFAAYLDGNLSQSDMRQFSQMVEHDSVLNQLLDASDEVDDTIAGFTDADLQLPNEILGSDFDLPDVDNVDFSSLAGDSFSDNEHLYQQEGLNATRHRGESHSSLVDEIFDDLDNNLTDDRETIETDLKAAFDGDPAAGCFEEIILAYPGLMAITVYRPRKRRWILPMSRSERMMTLCWPKLRSIIIGTTA